MAKIAKRNNGVAEVKKDKVVVADNGFRIIGDITAVVKKNEKEIKNKRNRRKRKVEFFLKNPLDKFLEALDFSSAERSKNKYIEKINDVLNDIVDLEKRKNEFKKGVAELGYDDYYSYPVDIFIDGINKYDLIYEKDEYNRNKISYVVEGYEDGDEVALYGIKSKIELTRGKYNELYIVDYLSLDTYKIYRALEKRFMNIISNALYKNILTKTEIEELVSRSAISISKKADLLHFKHNIEKLISKRLAKDLVRYYNKKLTTTAFASLMILVSNYLSREALDKYKDKIINTVLHLDKIENDIPISAYGVWGISPYEIAEIADLREKSKNKYEKLAAALASGQRFDSLNIEGLARAVASIPEDKIDWDTVNEIIKVSTGSEIMRENKNIYYIPVDILKNDVETDFVIRHLLLRKFFSVADVEMLDVKRYLNSNFINEVRALDKLGKSRFLPIGMAWLYLFGRKPDYVEFSPVKPWVFKKDKRRFKNFIELYKMAQGELGEDFDEAVVVPITKITAFFKHPQQVEKWVNSFNSVHDAGQFYFPDFKSIEAYDFWSTFVLKYPEVIKYSRYFENMESKNYRPASLNEFKEKMAEFKYNVSSKELAIMLNEIGADRYLAQKYDNFINKNKPKNAQEVPDAPITSGDYFVGLLAHDDPRNLSAGEYTGCCQHIDNVGAPCAIHAYKDPRGATLVVKKEKNIVAISWVWRKGDILVLDNIEGHDDYKEKIFNLIYHWAHKVLGKLGVKEVRVGHRYGLTPDFIEYFELKEVKPVSAPASYTDAGRQYLVAKAD